MQLDDETKFTLRRLCDSYLDFRDVSETFKLGFRLPRDLIKEILLYLPLRDIVTCV